MNFCKLFTAQWYNSCLGSRSLGFESPDMPLIRPTLPWHSLAANLSYFSKNSFLLISGGSLVTFKSFHLPFSSLQAMLPSCCPLDILMERMVARWLTANFLITGLGFISRYRHFLGDLLLQVAVGATSAGSYLQKSKANNLTWTLG